MSPTSYQAAPPRESILTAWLIQGQTREYRFVELRLPQSFSAASVFLRGLCGQSFVSLKFACIRPHSRLAFLHLSVKTLIKNLVFLARFPRLSSAPSAVKLGLVVARPGCIKGFNHKGSVSSDVAQSPQPDSNHVPASSLRQHW